MSELLVIAGVAMSALVCAALSSRWLINQSAELVPTQVVRAVVRASDRFMGGVARRTAIALAAMVGVGALLGAPSTSGFGLIPTVALCAGLLLGGLGALAAAYLACQLGIRIAARTATAASLSIAHTTNVLLRGGCVVVTGSSALALLGWTLSASILLLLADESAASSPLIGAAMQAAIGLALGAGASAMMVQLAGFTFSEASASGERRAIARQPEPQDALLLNHLVGRQVGLGASIGADTFFLTALGIATALTLMACVARANVTLVSAPLTLLAVPALAVSIGLVSAGFAIFSARSDETEDGSWAIWRGQVASVALVVTGLGAANYWLFAAPLWQTAFAASALGTLGGALLARFPRWEPARGWLATRRDGATRSPLPVREAITGPLTLVAGLGWRTLLLGGCLTLGWQLGASTGLAQGTAFGLALTLSGLLASIGTMGTIRLLEPLTQTAHALLSLTPSDRAETQLRAEQTRNLGRAPANSGLAYMAALGEATALIVCVNLIAFAQPASGPGAVAPAHLWAILLGTAGVSAYAGLARSRVTLTAEQLMALTAAPGQQGGPPRYREPLELATRGALAYLPLPLLATAVAAALVVAAIHATSFQQRGVTLHTVLALFVLAQVALTLHGGSLSEGVRQSSSLGEAGAGTASRALATDAFGPCLAASARAFTLTSAALSLLIATHST